jgi:hypothetical protein
MFCPCCGNSIPGDSTFCIHCGKSVALNSEIRPIAHPDAGETTASKVGYGLGQWVQRHPIWTILIVVLLFIRLVTISSVNENRQPDQQKPLETQGPSTRLPNVHPSEPTHLAVEGPGYVTRHAAVPCPSLRKFLEVATKTYSWTILSDTATELRMIGPNDVHYRYSLLSDGTGCEFHLKSTYQGTDAFRLPADERVSVITELKGLADSAADGAENWYKNGLIH